MIPFTTHFIQLPINKLLKNDSIQNLINKIHQTFVKPTPVLFFDISLTVRWFLPKFEIFFSYQNLVNIICLKMKYKIILSLFIPLKMNIKLCSNIMLNIVQTILKKFKIWFSHIQ